MRLKMLSGLAAAGLAVPAFAQDSSEIIGTPTDKAMGFQPAATELARDLQWLDGMINVIIDSIVGCRYCALQPPCQSDACVLYTQHTN